MKKYRNSLLAALSIFYLIPILVFASHASQEWAFLIGMTIWACLGCLILTYLIFRWERRMFRWMEILVIQNMKRMNNKAKLAFNKKKYAAVTPEKVMELTRELESKEIKEKERRPRN